MAEEKAIGDLEMQDSSSKSGEQNIDQTKASEQADTKLLQNSIATLQALTEDLAEQDLMGPDSSQMYHDTAEDADDEFDTDDDDFVKILPLNIKKAETGKDSDQGMQ